MYFIVNTAFVNYLDSLNNLTDSLKTLILLNTTTYKHVLTISLLSPEFDSKILTAPMQPPNPQGNSPNPMQPQAPPAQMPQLSWSYFKPEISGKPEEDVIAHLLRTNDWMESHNFPEEAKVQRFCLTLLGEARLWYETLRPTRSRLDRVTRML